MKRRERNTRVRRYRGGRRSGSALESLENRRMLSLADDVKLPLLFLDVPGSASTTTVSPGVERLDIKTTGSVVDDTGGTAHPAAAAPIIARISVLVNADGTLNGGVAGDDLKVFSDNDNSGDFSAGDTTLLSGEVRTTAGSFKVSGFTIEA